MNQFYADYDEETAMWCVFREEDEVPRAYSSSWGAEEDAKQDAEERNVKLLEDAMWL